MIEISVFGDHSEAFTANFKKILDKKGIEAHFGQSTSGHLIVCLSADKMPEFCRSKAIVLPTGGEHGLKHCHSRLVITCGFDRKSTVTPSSLLQEGAMATLQRELETLSGEVRLPGEFDLSTVPGQLEHKMIMAAALIFLDAL